jgi:hypothetical protein
MAYKEYSKQDLADFSGRPVASYTSYAEKSAIPQALLLFKIGTCLASPGDLSPVHQELLDMAIVSMADGIYLSQPFMQVKASPFSSETIGSYSYSKVAAAVAAKVETGIEWFDIATSTLSVCDEIGEPTISFGGIDMMNASDGHLISVTSTTSHYLSPSEVGQSRAWGYDPVFW